MKRFGLISFLLGLLTILALTLSWPDLHRVPSGEFNVGGLLVHWGKSGTFDVFNNILLFIPFGFGLANWLRWRWGLKDLKLGIAVLTVSFLLSYAIELSQVFMPQRFSSLHDVFSNTLGAIIGYLFHLLFLWLREWDSSRLVLMGWLTFVSAALLVSFRIQLTTSFANWEDNFYLVLGNEMTGDRPWRGRINSVFVSSRVYSPEEARQLSCIDSAPTPADSSLIAFYQVDGAGPYTDIIGNLPDLVWKEDESADETSPENWVSATRRLVSQAPARALSIILKKRSCFSLGVCLSSQNMFQRGPARIVSFSADPSQRNFTLAQGENGLVFRLRTPLTGPNGTDPYLYVSNVFVDTKAHQIVVTYDGSTLLCYVDGICRAERLELNPGVYLFFQLPLLGRLISVEGGQAIYLALVFVPVGWLSALQSRYLDGPVSRRIRTLSLMLLLPPLLLEIALILASGRGISINSVMVSMAITVGALFFFKWLRIPNLSV
jgi:hypothetical protein